VTTSAIDDMTPMAQIQRRYGVVGREGELAAAVAAIGAGRHLLLEGPAGVGKTTVALAVCRHLGREPQRVDGGNALMAVEPLVRALRGGRVLFIAELDRLPEAGQGLLLGALAEGLVETPGGAAVRAADGFQVVATQSFVEGAATGQLSAALRDRFERLTLRWQDAAEEAAIVAADTGSDDVALITTAVRLTRATRLHPRFRKGASVRGASATVAIAERLWAANREACGSVNRETLRRAAAAALAGRVELRDEPDGRGDLDGRDESEGHGDAGRGDDSDARFAAALDELFELVVERGEDPDVVLAPAGGDSTDV